MTKKIRSSITTLAPTGLISKGVVYVIFGAITFMAAFEIGGKSDEEANRKGVFSFVREAPAGKYILGALTLGLLCYSCWRMIEAFRKQKAKENNKAKRVRYFFSSLTYASVAFTAVKIMVKGMQHSSDQKQELSSRVLQQPFGQWLLAAGALILTGTGLYQMWYGLSEKYKKHAGSVSNQKINGKLLLISGKLGYVARGIVWLLLSYLMMKAAFHSNAGEAGDTGKAFTLVENNSMGSYFLAAIGMGLILYGIFTLIRARYENFG
jgi:hypothetical protein